MSRSLRLSAGLLIPVFLVIRAHSADAETTYRDPFWPIGYHGKAAPMATPGPRPTATSIPTRALTDEELRALALEEAERIRQRMVRDTTGIMKAGNRIFAYVQDKWVTVGDSFQVEVHGRKYRLEISELTEDNIGLTPHRMPVEATP